MSKTKAEKLLDDAFERHREVLEKCASILADATRAVELISEGLKGGNKVFACGNGGSAADADHFIGELLCRYKANRKPLPGISLVSPVSTLTAIANDYSYDDVFARQIQALGKRGDVLVAFSTSGRSKNVIAAMKTARKQGLKVILLTGTGGVLLTQECHVLVAVPSKETARIQEMHELIYHGWCEFLDA